MEAIILAGGFGTRLSTVISDVPKPMAPVCNKPFLEYILNFCLNNGIDKVVMAVGYKYEIIKSFFGNKYKNISIKYSIEDIPLFTGGAIKKALLQCETRDIFVINGDTYYNVDLKAMKSYYDQNSTDILIALKKMESFDRYGEVRMDKDNNIVEFREKEHCEEGNINGGIYLLNKNIFDCFTKEKFSIENDFFPYYKGKIKGFISDGYFIDIGIPEDYYLANIVFKVIDDD